MHVDEIKLINYRNYENLTVKLNPKLNIFLGNNAQGKTNLLESIYLCATAKSFRGNKDQELIHVDKNAAYVGLWYNDDLGKHSLEFKFQRGKSKRFKHNRVELDKISELVGFLNVVIFSPEDLKLVKEGPQFRRNFLNTEISQLKPRYRYALYQYTKVINQRNNYLKNIKYQKKDEDLLDVYDAQLIEYGKDILKMRIQFLERLCLISKNIHSKITKNCEILNLKYESTIPIIENKSIEELYIKALNDSRKNDIEKATTSVGPHRDDFSVWINKLDAKIYASQGQQRTSALSIKLAEVELMFRETGEYPILLLDDVLSELDIERRKDLISAFKDIQTIVTTTDYMEIGELTEIDKNIYNIQEGKIISIE